MKYDGSKVWGAHIIRYGIGYNRITGWTSPTFLVLPLGWIAYSLTLREAWPAPEARRALPVR